MREGDDEAAMKARSSPAGSERGAILVQVGLALIALLAFSAFVVDYGVLWVSRGQSQNAADAAALAGAVALSYDNPNDRSDAGPAKRNALNVALSHNVWGQAPTVTMADITFPPCPDDGSNACIRVDVYRPGLPTFFARLVGVNTQDTKATATAKAGLGNAVNCLKPWAVADKWAEHRPLDPAPWTVDSIFERFDKKGALLPNPVDVYYPPTDPANFTGFRPFNADMTLSADYGLRLTLKIGDAKNPGQMSSGWFQPLALAGTGGSEYRDAIGGCAPGTFTIGQYLTTEPGNMIGPTRQGVEDLVALDPGAYWDTSKNPPHGGVSGSAFAVSPRIAPVPLIDIQEYMSRDPSGRDTVLITNIFGFFIEGMDGKDVAGRLCALPGKFSTGTPSLDNTNSFLRTIQLVR
jgi:hypothetical protein